MGPLLAVLFPLAVFAFTLLVKRAALRLLASPGGRRKKTETGTIPSGCRRTEMPGPAKIPEGGG